MGIRRARLEIQSQSKVDIPASNWIYNGFVEGPLAGSRDFEYYVPKGDKTSITCVGEWKWAGGKLSDDQLRALVTEFYDEAFQEDKENLVRMSQEVV